MTKFKFPLGSMAFFCLMMILMYAWGFIGYIERADRGRTDLAVYGLIFSLMLILTILFLRRIILSFNAEVESRARLQESHFQQIKRTYEGTLQALTKALDLRDHATWGHSARVVGYALAIGEKMGLNETELNHLAWGGFLHDIGKIGVSDTILLKASALTDEEWQAIQLHPGLGYAIVNGIEFLEGAADIILLHHERYDGGGYPYGMQGMEIPLLARIFAVADALDAITSDRPYRPGCSVEAALEEIASQSGKQFCPECVNALLAVGKDRIREIQERAQQDGEDHGFSREMALFPGWNPVRSKEKNELVL